MNKRTQTPDHTRAPMAARVAIVAAIAVATVLALQLVAGCSSEMSADEAFKAGREAFLKKEYSTARDMFGKFLETNPSDRDALYLMGRAYRQDLLLDSALVYLKRAALLNEDDRQVNMEIVMVASQLQNWREVVDAIRVLAETGDGYEPWYIQLSDAWEAMEGAGFNTYYWTERALKQDSLNRILYLRAAASASVMDSTDLAIRLIDKAVALFGSDQEMMVTKALAMSRAGDFRAAERLLKPIAFSDTGAPSTMFSLAHILSRQDSRAKKQEALEMYEKLKPTFRNSRNIDSAIVHLRQELGLSEE